MQSLQRYWSDPVAFVHDLFRWRPGEGPARYQEEILQGLAEHLRMSARGPRGLGKTAIAAWAVLWFACTREAAEIGWKVPTTAGSWAQLSLFLWPEIRLWSHRLRFEKLGRGPFNERTELLDLRLKLEHGQAFAIASANTDLVEGSHAPEILFIIDESQAVPPATWDGLEGSLTQDNAMALAVSRPGEPSGRFYEIHAKKAGYEDWRTRHVTRDEAIAAGRMPPAWAEQRKKQWGEKSAVYLNHVSGEFAGQDAQGLIPLAWIELANLRYQEWKAKGEKLPALTSVGLDVSDGGADRSILTRRYGAIVPPQEDVTQQEPGETMALTGFAIAALGRSTAAKLIIDSIGVGAGCVSRARELDVHVFAFNASENTEFRDRSGEFGFTNKRAAALWGLRERLDPETGDDLAIAPDDDLLGELTAIRWKMTSAGKIQIEPKEDLKKRLTRSPDKADSLALSFWTVDDSIDDAGAVAAEATAPRSLTDELGLGPDSYDNADLAFGGWRDA